MTVLVIGGKGFVGRPLAQALRASGHRVVGTSRAASAATPGLVPCDITDPASIAVVLSARRPEVVINLATVARGSAEAMVATNVVGVSNLLEAVRATVPSCRVVLFGSAAEYGDVPPGVASLTESMACSPRATYGVTKLAATRLALAAAARGHAQVTVVRPFNVVGAGCPAHLLAGAVIERMLATWHQPGDLTIAIGRTDTQRDFIAVDDLVKAVVSLVALPMGNGVVNVCSGRPERIADVLDHLAAIAGRTVHWRVDPALVRTDEPAVSVGDPAKLAALTGHAPRVPLDHALAATWAHAFAAFQTTGE